jgi:hypothetical protein
VTARLRFALDAHTTLLASYRQDAEDMDRHGLFFNNGGDPLSVASQQGTVLGLSWSPDHHLDLTTTVGTAELSPSLFDEETARVTTMETRLSYTPLPGLSLTVRAGLASEDGSVLASRSAGGLRLGDGARTTLGGITVAWRSGRLEAYFEGSAARTIVDDPDNSLIRDVSHLWTSRYALGVLTREAFAPGDRIGIEVAQPLRVDSGAALIRTITGRDYVANRLVYDDIASPLSPSGREIDLSLGYAVSPGPLSHLQVKVLHQFDAGHRSGASATTLFVDFAQRF